MGKKLYAQVPKAAKKAIAGSNPVGSVTVGTGKLTILPQKQPSIHGLNVPPHSFRGASVKGANSYGRVAKMKRK